MEEVRRFLGDEGGERDYLAAVRLTDIDSKTDPVTEPYRSLYQARELWKSLRARIEACGSDAGRKEGEKEREHAGQTESSGSIQG